jgi:hypothetical protein
MNFRQLGSSQVLRRSDLFSHHSLLFTYANKPLHRMVKFPMIPVSRLRRRFVTSQQPKISTQQSKDKGSMHFFKAGLPLTLFCGLGVWVVSNGIEGKNRERDAFQGRISKSERQALMEKEHAEMMDKMSAVLKQDFDNTKRIERPEEILARRRKNREQQNRWYKRWWRSILGQ